MPNFIVKIKNILKETPPARLYRRYKYDKLLATPEKIESALSTFKDDWIWEAKERIVSDIKNVAKKYRFDAHEYFFYHLNEKNDKEKKAFISDREGQEIRALFNKGKNRDLFDNKWETYRVFSKYYKRSVILVNSKKDFDSFSSSLKQHGSLIIKPVADGSGHGVRRIDFVDDNENRVLFDELRLYYPRGFVAEEVIKQVPQIGIFHPQSVNTVRITTILLPNGVKEIHPFIRFGTGNRVMDNGGSGGLVCTIDVDTGVVYSAIDEANHRYINHPDSGEKIIGFKIPHWEEAKFLANELAYVVPDNRYTGWDLALTKDGWVMVEGNASGMFIGWQLNDQIGFRDEIELYMDQLGIRY